MNTTDNLEVIRRLEKENDKLRGIIAASDMDCIYCGLSKVDMSKCKHGFPGCGRGDDLVLMETSNEHN